MTMVWRNGQAPTEDEFKHVRKEYETSIANVLDGLSQGIRRQTLWRSQFTEIPDVKVSVFICMSRLSNLKADRESKIHTDAQ